MKVVADLMGALFVQLDIDIEKVRWEELFVQVDIKIEVVVADLGEDVHSTCRRLFQVNIEMKVK